MASQTCNHCFQEKPLSAFTPNYRYSSGYVGTCKQCRAGIEAAKRVSTMTPAKPKKPTEVEPKGTGLWSWLLYGEFSALRKATM